MSSFRILATAFAVFAYTLAASIPRATSCNGSPELCDRKYSNVSLVGTHDSAFVGDLIDPRVNQEKSVSEQLDAGIRFLQAQVHHIDLTDQLSMCHTSCLELYAGSLADYLSPVKAWMDANANEVLTMLLVNGDNNNVSDFDAVFTSSGLKDYAFVPSSSPDVLPMSDWPTYSEMISSGKRFVLFLDAGADTSSVDYILDEFSYFFETPYDTTDPDFEQCTLDRPAGSSPDGKMYIVNHFLDVEVLETGILIPDNDADFRTNAATGNGSIGAQAELCEVEYSRVPNVVLVDMCDRGDVFTAQNALNGL